MKMTEQHYIFFSEAIINIPESLYRNITYELKRSLPYKKVNLIKQNKTRSLNWDLSSESLKIALFGNSHKKQFMKPV
jgi:hypothetical protein